MASSSGAEKQIIRDITQTQAISRSNLNNLDMCGQVDVAGGPVDYTSKLVSQLQGDNLLLKRQLAEEIDKNKKWHAYDRKRDELVNTLLAKNKDLQSRHSSTVEDRENSHLALQWEKAAEEEKAMRIHLEKVIRRQQRFISDLQQAVQRPEDRERIELLENQVQVFSEDFRQERKDRERAQARIGELEEEARLLTLQLSQFQDSHMAFLADRRRATMDAYSQEYHRQVALQRHSSEERMSPYGSPSRLLPHGPSSVTAYGLQDNDLCQDGSVDSDLEDEDALDVPLGYNVYPSPPVSPRTTNFSPSSTNTASSLECPKCHKHFSADEPIEFLDHNDACTQ